MSVVEITRPRSAVTVIYRYNCCVPGCGVFHEEEWNMWPGSQLANIQSYPSIPGWRTWVGGLYCPAHKIKCEIDGETFDL
jgi:hypothetical protein